MPDLRAIVVIEENDITTVVNPSAIVEGNIVAGPDSAVDGHMAVFDGTSGALLRDGGAPGGGAFAYRLGPFKIGAFDGQTIYVDTNESVSGGTFTVSYDGQTTAALAWNISAANLKTALEGLSSIGAGNVRSVRDSLKGLPHPSINSGYYIVFKFPTVTELATINGTSLTGPDAPYDLEIEGQGNWSTEIFTPNVGDTILDFQQVVMVGFDSDNSPSLCYSDNIGDPFGASGDAWSSTGSAGTILALIDTENNPDNFLGSPENSPGYQSSMRAVQFSYSTPGDQVSTTLPIVCSNSVPIYCAVQNIITEPIQGEVWVWVDIVPATAP